MQFLPIISHQKRAEVYDEKLTGNSKKVLDFVGNIGQKEGTDISRSLIF